MACEECRDLNTHAFRSPDDLLHAVQVAALEVDRGVLRRLDARPMSEAESEAMQSIYEADVIPRDLAYRFQCTTCGDRFELLADTRSGEGGWTRTQAPA